MIYLTGGGVYGQAKLDGVATPGGAFSSTKQFFTWTVGGGYEAALWGNWTGKLEYLYIGTPNHVPVPPGTTSISGTLTSHIVRAGLNYRF